MQFQIEGDYVTITMTRGSVTDLATDIFANHHGVRCDGDEPGDLFVDHAIALGLFDEQAERVRLIEYGRPVFGAKW